MPLDTSEVAHLGADLGRAGAQATAKAHKVISKTAHQIEASAKTLAPVDTGALKSSISTTQSGLSAEIGPTVNYAAYVEEGTSRMGPQPYLGPATERHEGQFYAAMEQLAGEVLS